MSKRQKKAASKPQNEATVENAETTVIETAAETTTVEVAETNDNPEAEITAEPVVDQDVLAMLAGDDDDAATTSDASDDVVADEPTDDEVLATIAQSGTPPAAASGGKRRKKDATPQRAFTAVAAIDENALKSALDGCKAKKVREKAENLIAAVEHGSKLSRYTSVAVNELKANGRISGKSMVERFKAEGLTEGTARAQGQQMTALFRLVGAVQPDPNAPRDLIVQDNKLIEELATLAA